MAKDSARPRPTTDLDLHAVELLAQRALGAAAARGRHLAFGERNLELLRRRGRSQPAPQALGFLRPHSRLPRLRRRPRLRPRLSRPQRADLAQGLGQLGPQRLHLMRVTTHVTHSI